MSTQPTIQEILTRVRERVKARGPRPAASVSAMPMRAAPRQLASSSDFDFAELRRNVLEAGTSHGLVGELNPRNSGLANRTIQFAKKAMRRSLAWYTRPLHQFHRAVARSLEQSSKAIQHNYVRIAQLQGQINRAGEESDVRLVQLQGHVNKVGEESEKTSRKLQAKLQAVETAQAGLRSEVESMSEQHLAEGDATRTRLAGFEERLNAADERLNAAEQWSRRLLRISDSHLGVKAQAGLWFNPPIAVEYDEHDQAFWAGTTERIVERTWILRQLSGFAPGAKLLDVGSNESTLALELASNGYHVTAIDVRPYPLLHPNLQVVQGDICDSGLPSDWFDGVISLSTIEHIGLGAYGDSRSDLLATALSEIRRVLKPNGKLLITAPFGRSTVTELHRIFDSESLREVLTGWEIETLEFGRKIDGKTWISPVPEQAVNGLPSDLNTGAPSAVVMAVCVKRGN